MYSAFFDEMRKIAAPGLFGKMVESVQAGSPGLLDKAVERLHETLIPEIRKVLIPEIRKAIVPEVRKAVTIAGVGAGASGLAVGGAGGYLLSKHTGSKSEK